MTRPIRFGKSSPCGFSFQWFFKYARRTVAVSGVIGTGVRDFFVFNSRSTLVASSACFRGQTFIRSKVKVWYRKSEQFART